MSLHLEDDEAPPENLREPAAEKENLGNAGLVVVGDTVFADDDDDDLPENLAHDLGDFTEELPTAEANHEEGRQNNANDNGNIDNNNNQNEARRQEELIAKTPATTELEKALVAVLERKDAKMKRMQGELHKLKAFCQKRKQTYKRKRKDDDAPIRPMSAYNLFIKERFQQLSKENEKALQSDDSGAEMKRVPPASLISKSGDDWKSLPAEIKAQYEERAKSDRKRYEEEMAEYQPPDAPGRKRNKTGYNMFFSAHVLRLKATEHGVPSQRGSVARLVGNAWKALSADEKQHYEREADKYNGAVATPGGHHHHVLHHHHHSNKDGMEMPEEEEDVEEDEEYKPMHHHQHQHTVNMEQPYGGYPAEMAHHHTAMAGLQHMQQQQQQAHHPHDPRAAHAQYAYAHHVYAAQNSSYTGYDYSQHHQRHPQRQQQQQQLYRYNNYDPNLG